MLLSSIVRLRGTELRVPADLSNVPARAGRHWVVWSSIVVAQQTFSAVHFAGVVVDGEFQFACAGADVPRAGGAVLGFCAQLAAGRGVGRVRLVRCTAGRCVAQPVDAIAVVRAGHGRGRASWIERDGGGEHGWGYCDIAALGWGSLGCSRDGPRLAAGLGAGYGCLGECGVIPIGGGLTSRDVGVRLAVGGG